MFLTLTVLSGSCGQKVDDCAPLTPYSSLPCRAFQGTAMSTLYPSLEDLKVDQVIQVSVQARVSLGPQMEPSGVRTPG